MTMTPTPGRRSDGRIRPRLLDTPPPPPPPTPAEVLPKGGWLTITEAAYYCGVDRHSIWDAVQRWRQGRPGLRARRALVGSSAVYRQTRWLVRRVEVERYFNRTATHPVKRRYTDEND